MTSRSVPRYASPTPIEVPICVAVPDERPACRWGPSTSQRRRAQSSSVFEVRIQSSPLMTDQISDASRGAVSGEASQSSRASFSHRARIA